MFSVLSSFAHSKTKLVKVRDYRPGKFCKQWLLICTTRSTLMWLLSHILWEDSPLWESHATPWSEYKFNRWNFILATCAQKWRRWGKCMLLCFLERSNPKLDSEACAACCATLRLLIFSFKWKWKVKQRGKSARFSISYRALRSMAASTKPGIHHLQGIAWIKWGQDGCNGLKETLAW